MEKLYLVTRQDLLPEAQAVQNCHAAFQFAVEHKEIWAGWFERSNTLALLSVSNEQALEHLVHKAEARGLRFSIFREPDMNNALTAVAFEPAAKQLCRPLSLMTFRSQHARREEGPGGSP